MSTLPSLPGLTILSEMGGDRHSRTYRLDGPGERRLLLYRDPALARAVAELAEQFDALQVEGLIRVEQVVRHQDQVGVVLAGDSGTDPWRHPPLGELESLPFLHEVGQTVAEMHLADLAHGSLKPDGLRISPAGELEVVPAFILADHLDHLDRLAASEQAAPGDGSSRNSLSPAGRDLADLADLACHLIAGLSPRKPAGVGAEPVELRSIASPATAEAVRLLLEKAARNPTPAEACELLGRVGWAPDIGPIRRPRRAPVRETLVRAPLRATARPPRNREAAPTAASGRSEGGGEERRSGDAAAYAPRPERRWVPYVAVAAVALLGVGLLVVGGGGGLSNFFSGSSGGNTALPTPDGPLAGTDRSRSMEDLKKELLGDVPAASAGTEAPADLADQILEDLAARNARNPAQGKPKRSYDRAFIDQGDRLADEAKTILADIRDRKVKPEDRNARLDAAIQKLESAREKYESFVEQFPSRERLVEGGLEDVNSLIFFAYRQKTVR